MGAEAAGPWPPMASRALSPSPPRPPQPPWPGPVLSAASRWCHDALASAPLSPPTASPLSSAVREPPTRGPRPWSVGATIHQAAQASSQVPPVPNSAQLLPRLGSEFVCPEFHQGLRAGVPASPLPVTAPRRPHGLHEAV